MDWFSVNLNSTSPPSIHNFLESLILSAKTETISRQRVSLQNAIDNISVSASGYKYRNLLLGFTSLMGFISVLSQSSMYYSTLFPEGLKNMGLSASTIPSILSATIARIESKNDDT